MTNEEQKVHKMLQAIFSDGPLEAAYTLKGFWGKACARLITKNQNLISALEAAQKEAAEFKKMVEHLQHENERLEKQFDAATNELIKWSREAREKQALARTEKEGEHGS